MSDWRGTCWKCKVPMTMGRSTFDMLQQSGATFYCLWGHPGVFKAGPTEEDNLRRERDRLKQDAARLQDRIREAERAAERADGRAKHERHRANAYKGHATRITRRAKAGMCPCCRRTFSNMADHMRNEHPDFTPLPEEA